MIARTVLAVALTAALGLCPNARAVAAETIRLDVRQGMVIRLPRPAAAVFVADPDTADVQTHSANLVYVFGKKTGRTTLIAVDRSDALILERDIEVQHDLARLGNVVREIDPSGRIDLRSVAGGILLSGEVTEPREAQLIRETAARFLGAEETLVDRMEVVAPTQVNLRVRVAELSREVSKAVGVNWEALFNPGSFVFGLATGRDFITSGSSGYLRAEDTNGSAAGIVAGVNTGDVSLTAMLDLLERQGLVTMLAQPNLTALSGETASFLAGGEFPVPVGQKDNQIDIEFKQFGVSLAFTPTVLGRDRISLRVRPEVSELTDQGSIKLNDLVIPALSTRRAETTVELSSGQSFAIGGLLSNSTRDNAATVPGLVDVPILGPLFRSTNYRRSESELVIIVTPYLVEPVVRTALSTPLDGFRPATDRDRIIEGTQSKTAPSAHGRDLPLGGPGGFTLE